MDSFAYITQGLLVPRNPGLEDSIPLGLKNRAANAHENSNGTVYAAATGWRCVVKITSAGKVSTVLKSEQPWNPTCVFLREGDVTKAKI